MNTPAFLHALRATLGENGLLEQGDLSAFERDWRGRYAGRALAVARPANTEEVARVVQLCAEYGVGLVPQGGNTGLVGGSTPDESGQQLLLSLNRLNRVRHLDVANQTMTVDAGCVLQTVQEAAAAQGLLFPLSLASEGSCTIGGNLAANAGGTQVLRYGNARELCLGLEVVTATGEIWDGLSGLRKDNTGYDLRDLFIGSEGTLGVITAATLKLFPQPLAQMTALAACGTLEDAVRLLSWAQQRAGAALTGFELMNALSLRLVGQHFPQLPQPLGETPWTVLLELSDTESESHARSVFEALLEQALAAGVISDAVIAQSQSQAQGLWHLRESIPLAQAQEGLNIKHDIALPVSAVPAFVASADAALQQAVPGVRLVNFGHLGDGNLHYNVQAPVGSSAPEFLAAQEGRINRIVYDIVSNLGGSFSAEHGIGRIKREELALRKHPVALQMMRAIKKALDPQGLMNHGRML
ncbi:FAD-binding oxidoreductase [Roseateles sp.]|uniref:FAD-binding oxidoreductase n=1 Tax=Roseateles sp. TaxID=1971397 RepID=UPI003BA517CC